MTRGQGEGSIYKRASDGMWCTSIELPAGLDGKRRRKVVCRAKKPDVVTEMRKIQAELAQHGDLPTSEPLTLDQATEMILAAIQGQRRPWRGSSRRRVR